MTSNSAIVFAEDLNQEKMGTVENSVISTQKVQLINFEIPTEFLVSDTTVSYVDMVDGKKAEIIDNASSKVLATYSEMIENSTVNTRTTGQVWTSHIQSTYNLRPATINVYAEVVLRGDSNWRQIENVNRIWQTEGKSGAYELKDTYQSVSSPSTFPSTWMLVNITGQVYTESSWSASAGFSFSLLESAGFDMSGSNSGKWFARKNYNSQVLFRVMN
ncbi:hypothetical protein DOK67_0000757 [Enterococcus sp. DIV0212c]|uniref:hypothetical protein n=1 Tax=Enterococcus sp. DIV0212c TaxID=2230867 RepID=UPI001A9C1C0D|nr:hypothetical protein [Enterococcus sp. DIV0212c]MBO1353181.1 hypothetical protein [Enterococcus sp. DIV0212c]